MISTSIIGWLGVLLGVILCYLAIKKHFTKTYLILDFEKDLFFTYKCIKFNKIEIPKASKECHAISDICHVDIDRWRREKVHFRRTTFKGEDVGICHDLQSELTLVTSTEKQANDLCKNLCKLMDAYKVELKRIFGAEASQKVFKWKRCRIQI